MQRQGDEVAETAARHGVLVREQPIVGGHAEPVPPRHRPGNQVAAHPAGRRRGHGRIEEEPGVRPVARARTLDRDGQSGGLACAAERGDVLSPVPLVEIHREKAARLVREHGVDAGHVASPKVVQDHAVANREKRLVRTLPATYARLFADPRYPLVAAGGRVPRASGPAVGPQHREDVFPAPKQGSEQGDLPGRGRRDRIAGAGEFAGGLRVRRIEDRELRFEAPEFALDGGPPLLDRPQLVPLARNRVPQPLPFTGGGGIPHRAPPRERSGRRSHPSRLMMKTGDVRGNFLLPASVHRFVKMSAAMLSATLPADSCTESRARCA